MKAIIVDDEEEIGLIVSKILQKEGIQAFSSVRVNKALEKIESERFDLFFLDLHLPDGSGFDLIGPIRHRNPFAKIFIISAYDGAFESKRVAELDIDGFIRKPFSKNDILQAVKTS